jgi:HD superfamily phosphodiesterase
LQREWLPVAPPDAACRSVMDAVRAHLARHAVWPQVWAHVLRVTGNAVQLAPEVGLPPAHAFLLGVLHDAGKLDEAESGIDHALIGGVLARQQLATVLGLPLAAVEQIANAISKQAAADDSYLRLLREADKLDKIGATGIARRLSAAGRREARLHQDVLTGGTARPARMVRRYAVTRAFSAMSR